MKVNIREAQPSDFERLEGLLIQNDMFGSPEIDGREAMARVREIMGKYFLVGEIDNYIVSMTRACYDGSRAIINQLVVDKEYQKQGIGKQMIHEIALRLKQNGAPSVAVTTEKEMEYYDKFGFTDWVVAFRICFDIEKVIKRTG
jgi:N-acetylglutamate synthase-like GNAT family acetyltransferase